MSQVDVASGRILIIAPIGRDAAASADLLNRAGLQTHVCADIEELTRTLEDDTSAVLMAEEALFVKDSSGLSDWVRNQPAWSDLPFILLTGQVVHPNIGTWRQNVIASLRNVSLLERPVQAITLRAAVLSAVRARAHQHEVRKLLEEQRRAAEQLAQLNLLAANQLKVLDLAFEAANMGAWSYDLVTNVRHFDARAQKLYALPSDIVDHSPAGIATVVHAEDVGPMFDAIRKAADVNGDGHYEIEYRIARSDGQHRWLRAWGQAEFEGAGAARRAVRIVGASRDVTLEKESERHREQLHNELVDSQRRLAAELAAAQQLQAFSTKLISEQQASALYEQLLDAAMALMKADAASVQILEPGSQRLRLLASRNFHPDSERFWQWVDASSKASCGKALETNARVVIEDTERWTELADTEDLVAYRRSGLRSVQSTLLIARDGTRLGMISTHWREPRVLASEDFAAFDVLARQAADMIDRSQAEAALRRSEAHLEAELRYTTLLRDLAARLVTQESVPAIYKEILSAAIAITGSDTGTVQVYDPETHSLMLLVTRGISPEMIEYFHHVDVDSNTACGVALRTGRRTFMDFDNDGDVAARIHIEAGLRSAQATPLLSRDGLPIGMINTHWRVSGHRPSEHQLRFLDLLARQAADLIEQRRAEESLRESEERMTKLLTLLPVAVYACDTEGRLTFFNRRAVECWGRTPALHDTEYRWCGSVRMWHLNGMPLPHDECPMVDAAREGRATRNREVVIEQPNGNRIVALVNVDPLYDRNGKLAGAINAFEDITERKRADAALQESEKRLRQFGEASQDVLWIRDAETLQWTYLTPAFETIYGFSRDEALAGNNYGRWVELIVSEDRERVAENIRRVRNGEHVTFDYRIKRHADGQIRWLRNTDFPIIDESGNVALIGGIGHDLSELRETELRLKTLIQGIPQLVWRAVAAGRWTWASPQWEQYTGLTVENSTNYGWLDAVHPDDRTSAREAWSHAHHKGGFEVEYRLAGGADHEYRWFQTRATALRDDSGNIIEWLGTSTDIHELRELQGRQRVMVGELQHRTRNLMSVVRLIADRTMKAGDSTDDFHDRFRDRLQALARVQGLLSRLEDTDRVAFDELIRTEIAALDGAAERVKLEGPSHIKLRSSMVQTLAMALHELGTNALKYGALGQPDGRLAISWRMVSPDRRGRPRLQIDWRESGVEMPAPGDPPRGSGHGRELIEEALPYQLDAETRLEFGPDGVHCTITIPVSTSNAPLTSG